ncbi:MAG TPA: hypothetical protein VF797_23750, partial [Noviherbaspirillum sp.]
MLIRRSLTSRLRLAAAVCTSIVLGGVLAGCGGGDTQQGSASGTRLLAEAPSASVAPVAPGNIRMHF